MRAATRRMFVALGTCALVAGCGSSGPDRASTVTATPTHATTNESQAATVTTAPGAGAGGDATNTTNSAAGALDDALLSVSDLPTGWSTSPPSSDDASSPSASATSACDALYDSLDKGSSNAPDEAAAQFSASSFGPFLAEGIGRFAKSEDAKNAIDSLSAAINKCPVMHQAQDDGSVTSLTAAPLSFPKLGDQTFSAQFTGKSGGFSLGIDLVFVRSGRCLVDLVDVSITGAPDATTLGALAPKAVDRAKASC